MRVARRFAFLFVLAAACGGTAAAPAPLFPAYTKEDASLFDDFVDPRVLGVGYDAPVVNPRSDSALFERAQIGDGVVRGRIDSVTVKGSQYELGIRVIEPLGRAEALGSDFALRIGPDSPSFGMVKALESRLSGHSMIVFVRTYANESGEPLLHFHMVPDDPRTAQAVREAMSLDRVPTTGDGGTPSGQKGP
ncbi:MAG: hypothetical protein U0235_07400 [Polyangiaceae bacterium]